MVLVALKSDWLAGPTESIGLCAGLAYQIAIVDDKISAVRVRYDSEAIR